MGEISRERDKEPFVNTKRIGDKDLKQLATKYNLNEKYAREAKNVLTNKLEVDLFSLYSGLTTAAVGNGTLVQADLDVRQAIRTLDNANFDLADTAFFFTPQVYWDQLGGIVKYYSQNLSEFSFLRTGNFGPGDASRGLKGVIYDIPVYTSSNVQLLTTVAKNLLPHKSAFGFAIQTMAGNRIRVQMENQLRNLGMLAVVDMVYGVATLRSDAGVLINALAAGSTA